jgi:hypothetical protein
MSRAGCTRSWLLFCPFVTLRPTNIRIRTRLRWVRPNGSRQEVPLSQPRVKCDTLSPHMWRLVASLVLSVMAWSFVAPMALAVTGNDMPACCRRNGKHHCMSGMSAMAAMSSDAVPGFRASSPGCPYRSQTATPTSSARPQMPAVSALRQPSSTLLSAGECAFLKSHAATFNWQRGPPYPLDLISSD